MLHIEDYFHKQNGAMSAYCVNEPTFLQKLQHLHMIKKAAQMNSTPLLDSTIY